ncbi:hypothetical protein R5R35_003439 [Gryllus longicercus]|uniref:Uncharacterized protein n=1 Tax=Gryllus longicercus TaxID=2509291 RepID=A0AAN9Z4Z6_9ORTH
MALVDAGNLADKDGFHEVKLIKLDAFLVLRVRNSDFWRVLYLYPVSGTRDSLLGDLLGFLMSTPSDFMKSDGPAWYICSKAYFSYLGRRPLSASMRGVNICCNSNNRWTRACALTQFSDSFANAGLNC